MMNASDIFVKCLEEEKVEYVFALPGEENLELLNALRKSKIRVIVTRHEQGAAFMAATYGRLTGKAGVVLTTLGPGATNLITGIAYAQLGGMPLIAITGQKPIKTSKQGDFQIIDVPHMFEPVTKLTKQIVSGERIPTMVREAFRVAEEERPGAVHLELPEDIASEEVSSTLEPVTVNKIRRPVAARSAILSAANIIENAKSPLLLLAAGANRHSVSKSLNSFIHKTKIPFFTTQMGKGVVSEDSPHYLGCAALTNDDYIHCAIDLSDLIISIGHDVTEKPPAILKNSDKKIIHINFYSAKVDYVYSPTFEVIGDIADSINEITKVIKKSHWDFEYFKKIIELNREKINEKSDDDSYPLKPQRMVRDLREALPRDAIIALDNGMYKLWIARNYPSFKQNTVLLDNALATMGAGLASAMGAKLCCTKSKVVCVTGDGGFMMNSQELETAVRLNMDLVVVIINDSGYGMIKWKQQLSGFKDFGLDFKNPDFVKYAESFGAFGYKVENAHDFKEILSKAINLKGVHVIDCAIDYSENFTVLTKELIHKTCPI